jgi:bifunctional DNA-binding transcriptional regulator/antitoxin component of YhaV-PrlF toxin-antitoxin module
MDIVRISSEYTVEIPEELRQTLPAGVELSIDVDEQGRLVLTPIESARSVLRETFGIWSDREDFPQTGVRYVQEIRHGNRLNNIEKQSK